MPKEKLKFTAAILAGIFVLSLIASLTSLETPTGQTVKKISYLNKGKSLRLFVKGVPEVESVRFIAKESVKIDELSVTANNLITDIGNPISKFTISSGQPHKYSRLILEFKIKKSKLLDQSIAKEDLKLYLDGKEVPLNFNKFQGGNFHFNSQISGFGDFVLTEVKRNLK